jgi:hypothetical protein
MSQRAAKVAIGTAVAGGAGLAIFLLTRKAKAAEAAEGEADRARGDADRARGDAARSAADAASAAARAAQAQQYALDAARRLQQAQALVAWTHAHAEQSGAAARSAINQANQAIAQANRAAAEARGLFLQAQAERNTDRREALEREAKARADHAEQLNQLAAQAKEVAERAEGEARARADAERKADDQRRQQEKEAKEANGKAVDKTKEAIEKAGPDVVNIECIRQAVASGFNELKTEVQKAYPRATTQQLTNTTAATMRTAGVNLDRPNPALPFWQQPCDVVRQQVRGVINAYITQQQGKPSRTTPPIEEPTPADVPPRATVQTPFARKQKMARDKWAQAIQYAVQTSTNFERPMNPAQALAFIRTAFQRGSCLAPTAECAVPVPSALTQPVPFWANAEVDVARALDAAFRASVSRVNTKYILITVLDPKGRLIWVLAEDIQRDPNGKLIFRVGSDGKEWPLAKQGVRARDPQEPFAFAAPVAGSMADFVEDYRALGYGYAQVI